MPIWNPLVIVINLPDNNPMPVESTVKTGDEEMQNWQVRSAAFTAKNDDRILADLSETAWALKLPPLARTGDELEIAIDGNNILTIDGNQALIEGIATPYTVSGDGKKIHCIYKDEVKGWVIMLSTSSTSTGGGSTTPTPTPTPTTPFLYVASQSSVYTGTPVGTFENLTDSLGTTGTGTSAGDTQWIKATFEQPTLITAITVGGGSLPSFGGIASYLNGCRIEWSSDDTTWNNLITVSGVENSGENQFKELVLPSAVTVKHCRIAQTSYVATSMFKFR